MDRKRKEACVLRWAMLISATSLVVFIINSIHDGLTGFNASGLSISLIAVLITGAVILWQWFQDDFGGIHG